MPKPTPTGLVNYSILIEGSELAGTFEINSIVTYKGVNKIPFAKIILLDGSVSAQDFDASSGENFVPGKKIEIKAGWDSELTTVFKGIVVKHSIKINESDSFLIIECKDECVKLSLSQDNQTFEKQTDDKIINAVVSNAGLSATIDSTTYEHPKMFKYDCSDWDFILMRADYNSLLVIADDGDLSIKTPELSGEAALTLEYGNTIYNLESEMDASTQLSSVSGKSWDISNQATVSKDGTDPSLSTAGNITSSDLADVASPDSITLLHSGSLEEDELDAWGKAKLFKSQMSKIQGRVKCDGFADIKPGNILELKNLGDRFNGNHFVSAVRHEIFEGEWFTHIQFGMDPRWFCEQYELNSKPAAGLTPPIYGLQIAKVKAIQDDPDEQLRIQVNLPMVDDENTVWARMAFADAGDSRGICFRPEIDDEVVVGFLNNDSRFPLILGTLYSKSVSAPVEASDDNNIKGIYTKSGISVEFDDEKVVFSIQTPNGNTFTVSDNDQKIDLTDQNGNEVTLNSDGITLKSAKDVQISAQGNISLETSMGDVTISGNNVSANGQTSLKAAGGTSTEVSSSGSTSIKGSIVQIN